MAASWVQKIISRIDLDWVFKKSKGISAKDIKKALSSLTAIYDKIKDDNNFKDLINEIKSVVPMVKDYFSGSYKEVPMKTIGAIVFALLYTLSPIDLIPDFIPAFGLMDDAAVWVYVLKFAHADLTSYKKWKGIK